MNHLGRICAAVATLASIVLTSVVLTVAATPAALAMPLPPPGAGSGIAPPPPPVRVIAEGGMPGWQIALIAMAAALVAATAAVLLDHAWTARMSHAPTA